MVEQLFKDDEILWRSHKTILEMLKDRGYMIDEEMINLDYDSFKDMVTKRASLNMFALRDKESDVEMYEQMKENPELDNEELGLFKVKKEPIYICFATQIDKVGKDTIGSVLQAMDGYSTTHKENDDIEECMNAILVVRGNITSIARKVSKLKKLINLILF